MMILPVRSSGPVSYGYSELENNNEVSVIYFVFHLKSLNVYLYFIEFTWIFSIKRFVYNREIGISWYGTGTPRPHRVRIQALKNKK
jgi:hypothetical protein